MEEGSINGKNVTQRVINYLTNFVERVTRGDATPEEIEILPKVAEIILNHPIPLN